MDNQVVPYRIGYDYGIGVNSATGGRMQQAVEGKPVPVTDAPGGSGVFQIKRIDSTSDLEDQLGISADASGGVGLFSASDRFTFSKDCKIQTNCISLLLWCTQQNGFTQLDRPQLDEEASKLVADGNATLFAERYGDCFVAGLTTGGQFWGVLKIFVRTEADRQTIENSLSGSYGPFSADIQVKLNTSLAETGSSAEVSVYYEGGNVQKKPLTPKELFDAADEWSASVRTSPKPYSALLLPWVIADGPSPPNAVDLEHQRDVLKNCAKLRSQVQDRLNLLEYMMDSAHAGEFTMAAGDAARLAKLHSAISGDYDLVLEAASFALDHPKEAVEPETYARTNKGATDYVLTLLPDDLPKRLAGLPPIIKTPDFTNVPLMPARAIAGEIGIRLIPQFIQGSVSPALFMMDRIQEQDPAPGTLIAPGSAVHVTVLGPVI